MIYKPLMVRSSTRQSRRPGPYHEAEEVRFAVDLLVEGRGVEPSVPRQKDNAFFETPPSNSAILLPRAKPVPSGQGAPVPLRHGD
jgi:hypothetical protein